MLLMSIVQVHQRVARRDVNEWGPDVGPIVPEAAQATHITIDQIFNQIAVQVAHNEGKAQKEHASVVAMELILNHGDLPAECDPVAANVEEKSRGPCVRIASGSSPIQTELDRRCEYPDGE